MIHRTIHFLTIGLAFALTSPAWARQGMKVEDEPPAAATATTPARTDPSKEVRPPAPAEPEKAAVAVPYLLTFAIAGAAVGLAVFPSGRTHQD
jgi:hypothetical protein